MASLIARPVEDLLDLIIKSIGLDLAYRIEPAPPSTEADTALMHSIPVPELRIVLSGPDAPLLTANHGEMLHAIEHIAAKVLNLEPEQHDRISLDANDFKLQRDRALEQAAQSAIAHVRETGRPYAFPPMTSRERRMLHVVLAASGLPTASSGEGAQRFVVLYPNAPLEHLPPAAPAPARTQHIRSAFRPR